MIAWDASEAKINRKLLMCKRVLGLLMKHTRIWVLLSWMQISTDSLPIYITENCSYHRRLCRFVCTKIIVVDSVKIYFEMYNRTSMKMQNICRRKLERLFFFINQSNIITVELSCCAYTCACKLLTYISWHRIVMAGGFNKVKINS